MFIKYLGNFVFYKLDYVILDIFFFSSKEFDFFGLMKFYNV